MRHREALLLGLLLHAACGPQEIPGPEADETEPGAGGGVAAGGARGGSGGAGGGVRPDAAPNSGGSTGFDAAAADRPGGDQSQGGTGDLMDGPAGGGAEASALKEPCAPAKDLSCAGGTGNTGEFGPPSFCFRTGDAIAQWGCSNPTGWSLKVNGKAVPCNASIYDLPPPIHGLLYFELVADERASQTSVWWQGICKAGPYPPWPGSSGGGGDAGAD